MTDQLDYTDWTSEQHLAKAAELAAKADQFGDSTIASEAARRMSDVQQVTARGWLHAKLAGLKRGEAVVTGAPQDLDVATPAAAAETVVAAETAAPHLEPESTQQLQARPRRRNGRA